jgi:hypothetical protein
MPKIGLPLNVNNDPEVNPVVDEIQKCITEIENLLHGRIDGDNIWKEGDSFAVHSPKDVVDLADTTRPITGDKLFGGSEFEDSVLAPLVGLTRNNKRMRLVFGATSFVYGGEDSGTPAPLATGDSTMVFGDGGRGVEQTGGFTTPSGTFRIGSSTVSTGGSTEQYKTYSRKITIEVPDNYRVLKYRDMRDIYRMNGVDPDELPEWSRNTPDGNSLGFRHPQYVYERNEDTPMHLINYSIVSDLDVEYPEVQWDVTASKPTINGNSIEMEAVIFLNKDLNNGYLNIDLQVEFLCEEML